MKKQNRCIYNRTLKLSPAIGDWTTIKGQDPKMNDIQVGQVQYAHFDSLPRDKMKQLHMQHYRFAEMIATQLSNDMNIKIELHTIHATQMTYQGFLKSQSEKVIQSDFCLTQNNQNRGRINLIFDWGLAEMIANRLAGGKGSESGERSFTELEKITLEVQMEALIPLLSDSWSSVFSKDDVLLAFNAGYYSYDKKISLREAYIVFAFHVFFGEGQLHKITMAYPSDILRWLMTQKEKQKREFHPNVQLSKKTLKKSTIPIEVTLGKTALTMAQLKGLQKGSVILLDTELNKPLEVNVGAKSLFLAQPGIKNERIALQILSKNDELSSNIEKSEGNSLINNGPNNTEELE